MKEVEITTKVTFSDGLIDDEVIAARITKVVFDTLAEEATDGVLLKGEIAHLTGQADAWLEGFEVSCPRASVRLTWEDQA